MTGDDLRAASVTVQELLARVPDGTVPVPLLATDVVVQHGPDALERVWHEVRSGRADPRTGHVLTL